ncbi:MULTISPECIES: hypothetical protein [unclassified Actinomyces]|uniref:hypothetical protein n=2 Tax=Actinomyces TaxID=1654 RepID=UPI00201814D0|nr:MULTISPECIES: hypothetical protein [unclassified Actinomyces]MCL3777896.1 hypothetical protein [Actinomyces sp. AC-20-1]MCL3790865.1 hypothetical protein [Actinomyces sp. 187325]MCL3791113.1 hypothetical protein [Actinomyces sp. 186855]MCL3793673.1 hypothetical protein [Actinomyces sp. 217892]
MSPTASGPRPAPPTGAPRPVPAPPRAAAAHATASRLDQAGERLRQRLAEISDLPLEERAAVLASVHEDLTAVLRGAED